MNSLTQISAEISVETQELLDRYVAANGVKRSQFIESAVLHHLSALQSILADFIIPPTIEVSRTTGQTIIGKLENPNPATDAMRALFDD